MGGLTASWWGISETVIHFVIYEFLKKCLADQQNKKKDSEKTFLDFVGFMACGATSKTCATCVAYPHGKSFSIYLFQENYTIFVVDLEAQFKLISNLLQRWDALGSG